MYIWEIGGREIQRGGMEGGIRDWDVPQAKSVEAVVAAWPRRLSQPANQPTTATCSFGARY